MLALAALCGKAIKPRHLGEAIADMGRDMTPADGNADGIMRQVLRDLVFWATSCRGA